LRGLEDPNLPLSIPTGVQLASHLRSPWMVNCANFAMTQFSEVRQKKSKSSSFACPSLRDYAVIVTSGAATPGESVGEGAELDEGNSPR
jgi:hypothetical protein